MKHACVFSFAEWREAARALLAQGIAPHEVEWSGQQTDTLFAAEPQFDVDAVPAQPPSAQPTTNIPRKLLSMLESAARFRAPDRWAFLYKVLWRWTQGDQVVISAADEDGRRLHTMLKTVSREAHKMHAFLRFRERPADAGAPRFVAWFEPLHDVLPDAAEHFARRMGQTSWLIATPQGTAMWDGKALHYGPPTMSGPLDSEDSGESLWLAYYRSTFNPARVNTSAMELHMPVRYWKNLPESKLIPDLVSQANTGGKRVAQTREVGERAGRSVQVDADAAQPERDAPTALDACRRCALWQNATQAVPGVGPRDARIMLVGEQPGDQEDLAGRPFVGPAGKLLDDVLEQAGLQRDTVYVTNAVKHFKWEPRGKFRLHKTPLQSEITACAYWLDHELAEVRPEVVVALGATALKSILRTSKASLTQVLGKPFQHQGRWVVATYHPAFVLRVQDEESRQRVLQEMIRGIQMAQELVSANGESGTLH